MAFGRRRLPSQHRTAGGTGLVKAAARGTGLGRKLLAHVAQIGRARNCKRLDLSVLHWNPARSFYEKLGFRELDEWRPYRLSGEGFTRLAEEADS